MRKKAGVIKRQSLHKQQLQPFEIKDEYTKFLLKSIRLVKLFNSEKV